MVTEVKPMEVKKTPAQIATETSKDKEAAFNWNPAEFIGEIKEELQKITWTSPEELKLYTKLVVGMTFICGMGIYFLDLIIQTFLGGLATIVRLIAG